MRLRSCLSPLALLASLTVTSSLAAQAVTDSAVRVDRLFERWATKDSPGCAVAVSRDGRTVLSRAYGMANLEYDVPNTPATIFEAGSVSKQFTAAAVVLLARERKLSLDDDIRKYFPELPDYGAPIRIRNMLNHTSGLRDWGTVAAAGGWPRGSRAYTHDDVLRIIARQRSLNFTPGSEYLYSNSNYNLLAMLVARVSGLSLADFTRRNIFEPLGMTSTSWRDDFTRVVKHRATAYDMSDGRWSMDMPFENVHGNGGLLTTVEDLLRWNRNFTDTTVGGAHLSSTMQERGRLATGQTIRYAMGLSVDRYRGVPEVSHSGATAGYRAYLVRYPEQRVGVALLCNAGNVPSTALVHQVADLFLTDLPAPADTDRAVTLAERELASRAGLYRSERDQLPMVVERRDGGLAIVGGPSLAPLSATTFRIGTGARRLLFIGDSSGRTLRVLEPTLDGDTTRYTPVPRWAPTRAELARFAGTYTSDEAESTIRIAIDSGRLVVSAPRASPVTLSPAYRDAFLADAAGYLFRFHRDARGAVTAVGVNLGRARDLRFTKAR